MPLTSTRELLSALVLVFGTGACDAGGSGGEDASTEAASDTGGDGAPSRCGPTRGVVAQVIDGDTIVLGSGEKIRYLMVNTPEISNGKNECFGKEALDYNRGLVHGQEVELAYDVECADQYGRLLAYVTAPDGEVNILMISRGYGCVLEIPPNGADRSVEFASLERAAREQKLGLWGTCGPDLCG